MAAHDVFDIMSNMKEFCHMSIGVSLCEIHEQKLVDRLNYGKQVRFLEDSGKASFP